ncbi:MAG: hypothetical protein IKU34_07045 [Clostridia bacterium]|nr:hypothetical protein [Clostridia bacterium]
MNSKTAAFLENARLLRTLGILPLMYGSLGLEYLTGKPLNADDVDILIPGVYVGEKWQALKALLEKHGYTLIDEHEHEFEKDGVHFAYACIEELGSFAGIRLTDIAQRTDNGVPFQLLSLEQYLKVYTASAKDGYRINTRNKKDHEKIRFIESLLYSS